MAALKKESHHLSTKPKYMKYLLAIFFLAVVSCNTAKDVSSLLGVYTASYEHEFGKTDDTLVLMKANDGNDIYKLERHSGLIKKLDDRQFPKQVYTEIWTLQYDADKQTLTDLTNGKTLVWDSDRLTLHLGNRTYKKTKG